MMILNVPPGTEGLSEGDIITFGEGSEGRIGLGLFFKIDPRQRFRVHIDEGLSSLDKKETT